MALGTPDGGGKVNHSFSKIMDTVSYNRDAWNRESLSGSRWCEPVDSETIRAAKEGEWQVILTPNKSVPRDWFGNLSGKKVLCLASGGGQQAPVLAAAGASVVSFDNSDEQLAKDEMVALRERLDLTVSRGDMADLSLFDDESFDLIFHPVSNVFVESIGPVWLESYRVLKDGGRLLSGVMNPVCFLFDQEEAEETGILQVRYALPYSDLKSRSEEQLDDLIKEGWSLQFGHTLEEQIGGQIEAGFTISGFYEDSWNDEAHPLNKFASTSMAILSEKKCKQVVFSKPPPVQSVAD